ncbi:RNA polymerase sigma factor [Hyphomonas sp.]|uniref:RNA polymerase sigma factor n=1 Tax=Hyphomonas sp. TaxID=87 RepID=UPI00391A2DDC
MDSGPSNFRAQLALMVPKLRRFGHALTGSADAADDLVQDALERAIRKEAQFEPGTRLDSWMFRIMQTLWIDDSRKRKVRRDHAAGLAQIWPSTGEDGRVSFPDKIAVTEVRDAMARLPEDCRAVLALVTIEGLSYLEAADALDIPPGTVMSRLARARRLLLDLIDPPPERGTKT